MYVTILLQKDEGVSMTIYNAIFTRKSVRNYKMEPVSDSLLQSIYANYEEIQKLFLGIETELQIVESLSRHERVAMFGVRAPYYLLLYTEEKDKCYMNAGFIMEQMSLFLSCKGIGSCFVGSPVVSRKYARFGNKKLVCILAFGRAKGSTTRRPSEFKRLDMNKLCVYKEKPRQWMCQLLDVARLAPSSMNSQTWRFLVYDNKIHIFCKKSSVGTSKRLTEINFGILYAHMMVAAEELWLDLDLIRLENISQKNFANSEYMLSAVLNS